MRVNGDRDDGVTFCRVNVQNDQSALLKDRLDLGKSEQV
jgi:hypothetical protein